VTKVFHPLALNPLYEIDAGLVESLVAEFKTLAPTLIEGIQKGHRSRDFATLALHARSLKSSTKVLGFEKIAERCHQIEVAAHEKSLLPDADIATLPILKNEALLAIERYLELKVA